MQREHNAMTGPEAVVSAFLAALEHSDWAAAAERVHRSLLLEWYESRVASPDIPLKLEPVTVDTFRRLDPEMPDMVAAYMADRHNRQSQHNEEGLSWEFANIRTREELRRLDSRQAMACYLEALDSRYQVRRAGKRRRVAESIIEQMTTQLGVHRTVVGSVAGSDGETSYVVVKESPYAETENQRQRDKTYVVLVQRQHDDWALHPTGHLFEDRGIGFAFEEVAQTGP
jgi:hypothetical protein